MSKASTLLRVPGTPSYDFKDEFERMRHGQKPASDHAARSHTMSDLGLDDLLGKYDDLFGGGKSKSAPETHAHSQTQTPHGTGHPGNMGDLGLDDLFKKFNDTLGEKFDLSASTAKVSESVKHAQAQARRQAAAACDALFGDLGSKFKK